MRIEVTNGELRIPLLSLLGLSAGLVVFHTLLSYVLIKEPPENRICHVKNIAYVRQWEEGKRPPKPSSSLLRAATHPGCSAEPEYASRDQCPSCFRSAIPKEFNDSHFSPASKTAYLTPRGPSGFFRPKPVRQQELINTALITPRSVCVESCPYLVALVLSMQQEKTIRDDIRKTWASAAKTQHWADGAKLRAQVGVIFVIAWGVIHYDNDFNKGRAHEDQDRARDLQWIAREASIYNDILLLDMVDMYSNLTLKVASALSWAHEHCRNTKFFLKIDQDTFLNLPLVLDLLIYHEARLGLSVVGHIYTSSRPVSRVGRWGVDKHQFPMSEYPVFAAGCAYILSREATSRVLSLFPYFPYISIEDAFITGVLGRVAGLDHFSPAHRRFFTEFFHYINDWCSFLEDKLMTGTGVDTRDRRHMLWASYIANDWSCRKLDLSDASVACSEEFPRANF